VVDSTVIVGSRQRRRLSRKVLQTVIKTVVTLEPMIATDDMIAYRVGRSRNEILLRCCCSQWMFRAGLGRTCDEEMKTNWHSSKSSRFPRVLPSRLTTGWPPTAAGSRLPGMPGRMVLQWRHLFRLMHDIIKRIAQQIDDTEYAGELNYATDHRERIINLYSNIINVDALDRSTPWVEKKHAAFILRHNFGKCWPIFKVFTLLGSAINFQINACHISNRT